MGGKRKSSPKANAKAPVKRTHRTKKKADDTPPISRLSDSDNSSVSSDIEMDSSNKNHKALINVNDINPPVNGLPRTSVQLEELSQLLFSTDQGLNRNALPRPTSLYVESITEARNLVYGLLYYVSETNQTDYQTLFGQDQRMGNPMNPTRNWRWLLTDCPVMKSAWLNRTPQSLQSFSGRLGNNLSFEDNHPLSPFGNAICFILSLFHRARYDSYPVNATVNRKARLFTSVPKNQQFEDVCLYLDFNCPTIKMLGITHAHSFPNAFPIQPDPDSVLVSVVEDDQDILFEKIVQMKKTAKHAALKINEAKAQKAAAEEVVKGFEKTIAQYEQMYNDATQFVNRHKLALQIGSTAMLEKSDNTKDYENLVTVNYKVKDNDVNLFSKEFVRTNAEGQTTFYGSLLRKSQVTLDFPLTTRSTKEFVATDLLISSEDESSGLSTHEDFKDAAFPSHQTTSNMPDLSQDGNDVKIKSRPSSSIKLEQNEDNGSKANFTHSDPLMSAYTSTTGLGGNEPPPVLTFLDNQGTVTSSAPTLPSITIPLKDYKKSPAAATITSDPREGKSIESTSAGMSTINLSTGSAEGGNAQTLGTDNQDTVSSTGSAWTSNIKPLHFDFSHITYYGDPTAVDQPNNSTTNHHLQNDDNVSDPLLSNPVTARATIKAPDYHNDLDYCEKTP